HELSDGAGVESPFWARRIRGQALRGFARGLFQPAVALLSPPVLPTHVRVLRLQRRGHARLDEGGRVFDAFGAGASACRRTIGQAAGDLPTSSRRGNAYLPQRSPAIALMASDPHALCGQE